MALTVSAAVLFAAGTGAYRPIHNLCETVAGALANLIG